MICSRSSAQQRCEADQPGVNAAAWRRANSAAEIGARPTNCWKESVMRSVHGLLHRSLGRIHGPLVRRRQRDLQVGERGAAVHVVLHPAQNCCVSEPQRTRVSQPFLDQRREILEPGL